MWGTTVFTPDIDIVEDDKAITPVEEGLNRPVVVKRPGHAAYYESRERQSLTGAVAILPQQVPGVGYVDLDQSPDGVALAADVGDIDDQPTQQRELDNRAVGFSRLHTILSLLWCPIVATQRRRTMSDCTASARAGAYGVTLIHRRASHALRLHEMAGRSSASVPSGGSLVCRGVCGDLNPINRELLTPTALIAAEGSAGALLGGAFGGFAAAMATGCIAAALRSESHDSADWWSTPQAGYLGALLPEPMLRMFERQGGARWALTLGAYAGTAAGVGLAYIAFRSYEAGCRYTSILLYILARVAPLSGAVIGYNISTPCFSSRCHEQRFVLQMPGVVSILHAVAPPRSGVRIHLVSVQIRCALRGYPVSRRTYVEKRPLSGPVSGPASLCTHYRVSPCPVPVPRGAGRESMLSVWALPAQRCLPWRFCRMR